LVAIQLGIAQPLPRAMDNIIQLLLQHRFGRQFGQVFGDMDAGLIQFQQFNLFLFFTATQDNA
jgi:hypothetical protein